MGRSYDHRPNSRDDGLGSGPLGLRPGSHGSSRAHRAAAAGSGAGGILGTAGNTSLRGRGSGEPPCGIWTGVELGASVGGPQTGALGNAAQRGCETNVTERTAVRSSPSVITCRAPRRLPPRPPGPPGMVACGGGQGGARSSARREAGADASGISRRSGEPSGCRPPARPTLLNKADTDTVDFLRRFAPCTTPTATPRALLTLRVARRPGTYALRKIGS